MAVTTRDRYINDDVSQLEEANRNPIDGYQDLPIMTLEAAVKKIVPFVPSVLDYALTATKECNRNSISLTSDESAAIYLYSMPTPFFSRLNETLRAENRHNLKPWFAFLKLFVTALEKLPSTRATVWRGVASDVGSILDDGDRHIWWSVNSCTTDLSVVERYLGRTGTMFTIDTIHGKDISAFSTFRQEKEIVLAPGTHVRAKSHSINFDSRFIIVHLQEETSQSTLQVEPNHLCQIIRQKYKHNTFIERIMNPTKSFPIAQSYINLTIEGSTEQRKKEEKLGKIQSNETTLATYEEIYSVKTSIEVKDIFTKCKNQIQQVLIFGRAGIGKTTFCRYIAYQWAIGTIWQHYQLVILIRLRGLTESRYPPLAPGKAYSLFNLVEREYFHHGISEEDAKLLEEELKKGYILWILDGYDEIIRDVPSHLHYLLEQLLTTPHHILTSRPYLNTLSYNVRLEIIGFTDENIEEYVKQFFHQIKNEIDDAASQAQKLLSFSECNPRIWGIIHIPVNLELICSLWCDTDWSETTVLTMTNVYDKMIEWLCRRYLERQHMPSNKMTKADVYTYCQKELAFFESLAFNGMQNNSVLLRPKMLQIASKGSACSLQHHPDVLNIGILKALDDKPIGTYVEVDKTHYFLHISFQEHFAARYIVKALNGSTSQQKEMIDFIRKYKYNQRFDLMFTFSSGLLIDNDYQNCISLFWNAIREEPSDLVGLKHIQLIISCLEEADCNQDFPPWHKSIDLIIKWIRLSVSKRYSYIYDHMTASLRTSLSVVNQDAILNTLLDLLKSDDLNVKQRAALLISKIPISKPHPNLVQLLLTILTEKDNAVKLNTYDVLNSRNGEASNLEAIKTLVITVAQVDSGMRWCVCHALRKMAEKVVTNDLINGLVTVLGDANHYVRWCACETLTEIFKRTGNSEVTNSLMNAVLDENDDVRWNACFTLGKLGDKIAREEEVCTKLMDMLKDSNPKVRSNVCETFGKLAEKAATCEVIDGLILAFRDESDVVRANACEALGKMGEKAATYNAINSLITVLGDRNTMVRNRAYETLSSMSKQAPAADTVIDSLLIELTNENQAITQNVCKLLIAMGEKTANNKVINSLVSALGHANDHVRSGASDVLLSMAEKTTTTEITESLITALNDESSIVRSSACYALGKLRDKIVTDKVICSLVTTLKDSDSSVVCSVYRALGDLGKKAASSEVLSCLTAAMLDENDDLRWTACHAILKVDESTADNTVVDSLMVGLGHENQGIRQSACFVLRRLGKRAATNCVIQRLVSALGDPNNDVRDSACEALVSMGEKLVTTEVTNSLVAALENENQEVKSNVCSVLGKMGGKIATEKVVENLRTALRDENSTVRSNASKALGEISKDTASDGVIESLRIASSDINIEVKLNACCALGKIGEKVVTSEMIKALLIALRDPSHHVRWNVCEALRNIGKKARNNDVIDSLITAIFDESNEVRWNACFILAAMDDETAIVRIVDRLISALKNKDSDIRSATCFTIGKLCEITATIEMTTSLLCALEDEDWKVTYFAFEGLLTVCTKHVTNEVISKLLIALRNEKSEVRIGTCRLLGIIGEKVATNEVLEKLLNMWCFDKESEARDIALKTIESILPLYPSMSYLKQDVVSKLSSCFDLLKWKILGTISSEKVIKAFLDTNISDWLFIIIKVLFWEGNAITITEDTIVLYSTKEPLELLMPDRKLGQQLKDSLISWTKEPF